MGLLGFLFIIARRHKKLFPAVHQNMLLKGTIYTFVLGLLAYQVIDNSAHLGGFLAGVALGWFFVPRKEYTIPMKQVPSIVKTMANGSIIVLTIAIVFTIYKLLVG